MKLVLDAEQISEAVRLYMEKNYPSLCETVLKNRDIKVSVHIENGKACVVMETIS